MAIMKRQGLLDCVTVCVSDKNAVPGPATGPPAPAGLAPVTVNQANIFINKLHF